MAVEALAESLRYSTSHDLDAEYRDGIEQFCRSLSEALTHHTAATSGRNGWPTVRIDRAPAMLDGFFLAVTDSRGPGATLTEVYGTLLQCRPVRDPGGGSVRLVRSNHGRKASGSYFTPPWIAALVLEQAMHALPSSVSEPPTVFDPAMGTGVFLLKAARTLAVRWNCSPGRVAETCLFGVDSDPLAVEIAVVSLCLETGANPEVLRRHLRCADMLVADRILPRNRFDMVVGNPPWGARYSVEQRVQARQRFPASVANAFDSFKLFLDLGSERCTGSLAMVVPRAVLAQERHADVRGLLLERMAPAAGIPLGNNAFQGAAAPACILVFGRKPGPRAVRCFSEKRDAVVPVPASLWTCQRFPLGGTATLDLLRRLQERHPALGELSHIYRVRDTGLNYSHAAVARRLLYIGPEPDDPRDLPRYRGRNFGCYTAVTRGGWLRHDATHRLQPGEGLWGDWATFNLPEKIVFRQTADRIVATLDRTRMVMGRSVIALTAESDQPLLPLLGCLNSRLLTALYRALAGEEGRILPQVKVGTIKQLPLPAACSTLASHVADAGVETACDWATLSTLTSRLLDSQGRDTDALAQMDQVIYRLYGLSDREIALVERETLVSA